jgi:hypothetical protein
MQKFGHQNIFKWITKRATVMTIKSVSGLADSNCYVMATVGLFRHKPSKSAEPEYKIRFRANVCADIDGNTALGPYLIPDKLTAQLYDYFLETVLLELLQDVPPSARLRVGRARRPVDLQGLFTLQPVTRQAWTREDPMSSDDEVLITSASFTVQRVASIPLMYRQQSKPHYPVARVTCAVCVGFRGRVHIQTSHNTEPEHEHEYGSSLRLWFQNVGTPARYEEDIQEGGSDVEG